MSEPRIPPRSPSVLCAGFQALLVTQFFCACEGNLLKTVISQEVSYGGCWAGYLGDGGTGLVAALFTLPFILFSGWAGQIADRYSKQRVARAMVLIEIPIAIAAFFALWAESFYATLALLFLIATQNAFFGPPKYGMIAELVTDEALGRANGLINMLTNIAIIAGVILGGILSDAYPAERLPPGAAVVAIALLALAASRFLTPLPAQDPGVRYSRQPFAPYAYTIRLMLRDRYLFLLALGGSFFYFIAMMAITALPEFKDPSVLAIGDSEAAVLLIPLTVGIGLGSALAGFLMRKQGIRLTLAAPGTAGMLVFLALLGLLPLAPADAARGLGAASYVVAEGCLVGLGLFGGLYIVPFLAAIQERAPAEARGRVLGFANFFNFVFMCLGALLYFGTRQVIGIQATFIVCAALLLIFALYMRRAVPRARAAAPSG